METYRRVLFVAAVVLAGGGSGCGDDDSSTSPSVDPDTFCPAECQRRLDTNCPNNPPDYQQACELLCRSRYGSHPECEAEISAMDRCMLEKVTYVCNESGTIQVTPTGACANEAGPCLACLGDLFGCSY